MRDPKEIGKLLQETRQKKGFTIDEAYNKTRIQPKIIEALEEGMSGEVLGNVYTVLFLRKYASFLGLDSASLTANYKNFYTDKEEVALDIQKEPEGAKLDLTKWATPAISIGLVFVIIFFVLFLGLKLRSFRRARSEIKTETPLIAKSAVFPIPANKSIELVLQSTDKVWMKIKTDGKRAFEGTLPKGGKKKWSASDKLELWIGRAEALNFTINGKSIGNIGKGNIKNIQISRRGLKIRNKWLLKAKE